MVGSLKTTPLGFTHLLVAVDKFTKWVEAKPIRKLDGKTALKFVKDIMVRFGIPHSIITNNGSNLSQGEVEEYCHHNGIRLDLASVAHPESNGQVEKDQRTNSLRDQATPRSTATSSSWSLGRRVAICIADPKDYT
jgi:hypothetical protein